MVTIERSFVGVAKRDQEGIRDLKANPGENRGEDQWTQHGPTDDPCPYAPPLVLSTLGTGVP